jgi:PAS domain S-box-containing protein
MLPINATPQSTGSSTVFWRAPRIWVLGLWLSGLTLTAWLTLALNDYQNERLQTRFNTEVDRIVDDIERRFSVQLYGLKGARGVYAASESVNRTEFRRYVDSRNLSQDFPGLRGMGFIERVPRADLDAFVARERADGAPDFSVRTQGSAADLYVIKFIEPLARNEAAQGLDVGAEPVRREAAERAARTGLPALSGVIQLVQDNLSRPGFLLCLPVYQPNRPLDTPEQRLAALKGLAYAPIVLAELLQPGLDMLLSSDLHLKLSDKPGTAGGQALLSVGGEHNQNARHQTERSMVIAGLPLFLKVHSTPAFEAAANPFLVLALSGAGVLLSTLLTWVLWLQATGRARAEARAQHMTVDLQKLALVAQRTANSVLMTDPQLRITWVNEGFTRVTGYSADQAQGKTPGELLGSGKADPATLETLRRSAEHGAPCRVDILNRAKDGREYWIDTEVQPLRDEAGQLIGFIEIGLDITKERENNERLVQAVLESEAQQQELDVLARVARDISSAVVLTDTEGRIEWVNAGFTRITGYTLAEALGQKPGKLLQCPDTDLATIARIREALSGLQPCEEEILNRAKDGRLYWLHLQIQPLLNPQGKHTGFMAIESDITERRETLQNLQRALRENRALMKAIDQGAIFSVGDLQGCVLDINEEFIRISGYTREELIGFNHRVLNSGLQPDGFWQEAWFTISAGQVWRGEVCNRAKDGSLYWVDSTIVPLIGVDGLVEKYISIRTDITAQKTAQLQIDAQHKRLDNIIKGTNAGTWEWHVPTGQTVFNERWANIIGYTLAELEPISIETWMRLAHPDDLKASGDALQRHFSGELDYYEVESRMRHKDGHWVWVLDRGQLATREADGQPGWMFGTHQDITAQKQAELRLARSEALLERTSELARVGAWRVDLKTGLPEWSAETCRIHDVPVGYQPTMEEALNFYAPEARPIITELVAKGLQTGEGWDVELPFITATGRLIWVRVLGEVETVNGEPVALVGAFQEISQQRLQADALLAAKTQAEQASLFKSQFLANMSHEIRTPMNAILGMLKLLHGTPLQSRQLDYVDKTEGAANSLLGLLNDILDFSKVEAGKMMLDPQPFGLDKLLRDLSVIFSASVGSKPVEVLFDIDPQVPRLLVGDSLRLRQILINLGGNAIKFTAKGEVVLRVWLEAMEGHGPEPCARVSFAVKDSGIGIAPENQVKIFAGFTQAEASTTRRFGGSGLGLSICRRLIEMMGGELQLQSAAEEGSTFSFTVSLPLAEATLELSAPKTLASAPGLPVLVVDDNPVARELLGAIGASLGWVMELADSGESALTLISARAERGEAYRTVFVDWMMPGLDGWQTSARIRSMTATGSATAASPVIMMVTAHGREMLTQQTAEVQALIDGYLVKPITASMMFDAMQNALQPGGAASTARVATQVLRPLDGLRVLLVEDNAINQQVAEELLSGQGALVDIAENGLRGVEAVQASVTSGKPYHAVLMDMQMPVMDGLTATREIRGRLGVSELPIIAMTANAMASDREACLEAGMNDHVGKPFDLDRLVATLLQWVKSDAAPVDTMSSTPALTDGAANAPASSVTASLCLNRAGALQRVGGSVSLLNRLSTQFLGDLPGMLKDCEAALDPRRHDEGQRALHTLKGVAAVIGAEALADAARRGESACENGDAVELDALHIVAAQTRQSLLGQGVAAPAGTDMTATAALPALNQGQCEILQRMLPLLEASDMAVFDTMYELLAQGDSLHWTGLNDAVQAMDFGQAANWVRKALSAS